MLYTEQSTARQQKERRRKMELTREEADGGGVRERR